jgi:DedD protein
LLARRERASTWDGDALMDSAMRDLDQLRERDEETRGRKLGLLTLASVLSVAALFAAASLMGQSDSAEAAAADPLTELALNPDALRGPTARPALAVKPESLSFPATLVEQEDALVDETVRAAEAEHRALVGGSETLPASRSSADLPAGRMVTADNQRLSQLAKRDPLVANALPSRSAAELAPQGSEGAYTLQVVSYETREPAEAFAGMLRSRSHKAFVTQAEVPGRGRFFRVRVGPFTTRKEAETYQGRFEADEHMHTIVVSNAAK